MAARLQAWFARQSLTVKLLVTIPVLLLALLWSAVPGNSPRSADPGNRPVLSANATTAASATPATGQALLPHEEPQPVDTGWSWASAIRTLASIAVVIVLILLSAQGLKYLMAGAAQPLRPNQSIRVVETMHLPSPSGRGRAAVHLVEVGEQLLLLGATDTQLTLLTELPDEDAARLRRRSSAPDTGEVANASRGNATQATFADMLASADAGGSQPTPANGSGRASEADLAQLLQRLRDSQQRLESGE